ncbi:hypothetical protein S83_003579, partial [Arachis hypogaea]
ISSYNIMLVISQNPKSLCNEQVYKSAPFHQLFATLKSSFTKSRIYLLHEMEVVCDSLPSLEAELYVRKNGQCLCCCSRGLQICLRVHLAFAKVYR